MTGFVRWLLSADRHDQVLDAFFTGYRSFTSTTDLLYLVRSLWGQPNYGKDRYNV